MKKVKFIYEGSAAVRQATVCTHYSCLVICVHKGRGCKHVLNKMCCDISSTQSLWYLNLNVDIVCIIHIWNYHVTNKVSLK